MVRTYQRKFTNSRNGKNHTPYLSYCKKDLQNAVEEIQNGSLRLIEAANKYNIPKSTLSRKCRNMNCTQEKAGHPTLFSKDEEMAFIKYIQILSNWGFPLDSTDLRVFAQKYLNKLGKTLYSLKDNMPGVDWARNFMIRNKSEISNRNASNITSERAKISPAVIDDFFSHYENTIEGVSPDCIINYDETNLTDDPGHKKYLFKRGCKYPERVINTTKTSISLMFSGTANGQLLPTYVVYKADHLWDQWLEGGPEGTRYNRSKSGWFDSACFEDWFNTVIVPYAKTKSGRKVIIGDNLSSHFSESVLKTCEELNIIFVCLPPKTTHLLQPLDVAFYAPLKKYWRDVLTDWKRTEGLKHKTLVKSSFPMLLCRLQNKLREKGSESNNIIAGFNKCGLYPVNSERPKTRLPYTNSISEELIEDTASSAVIEILTNLRNPTAALDLPKRKRKCNVPPGKSITADDLLRVEKPSMIKSRQGKIKNINKCSKKMRTISNEIDRSNIDFDSKESHMEPIAGPSGQCKRSTLRKKYRGNESDSTYTSSEDEYATKNKNKPQKPMSSFKGKGKGKKSKLQAHKTNKVKKNDSQTLQSLNCTTAVAQSIRKRTTRKFSISTTSVSDTRSVHSDSDLLDVDFDDHSSDGNNGNDLSPFIIQKTDNSDKIENKRNITEEEIDERDKTKSCISNDTIKVGMSRPHSEMNTLPSMAEIRNDFDDKENGKKDDPRSEINEKTQRKLCDNEYNESVPLFSFDEIGSEEIVVGDDNNTVSLISFNEKELYSEDIINDKECSEVLDNVKNADLIENKENHLQIGKKLTIIKEESVENALKNKKVVFKDLKPVCLSSYINIPKNNNQKPKYRKNYYNDRQEILKALMDSD